MRRIALSSLLILIIGFLPAAQQLKHEVAVTLKLIQVFVLDKDGRPVKNLSPGDFSVYDNSRLQNITEFEFHQLISQAGPGEEAEAKTVSPSPAGEEDMNRKFFLFFDLVNNNTRGFVKAQEAAFHFLDKVVQPTDEVGVLSYSVLKQLTMHEYLSQDTDAVRKVINRIGGLGRVGRAENFEALIYREMTGEQALAAAEQSQPVKEGVPAHLRNVGEGTEAMGGRGWESNSRFNRERFKNLVNNMFERLAGLAKAMRYIDGHKHIVLFSSGVPYSLIHGLETSSPGQFTSLGMDAILRDKYQKMLRELSNSNTTIFSLNTEGLAANMNLPAHQKGEPTLRSISKFTGGRFLGNVQNYSEIIGDIQNYTAYYYVLGYYIDESWDGRFHDLKVEVARPGCEVMAQKGYYNPKPFKEYTKVEKQLHLIDLALSEKSLLQAPIRLSAAALCLPIGGQPGVTVMARIDGDQIRQSMKKEAEIYFLVIDDKENIRDVRMQGVKISSLKGKDAYYYAMMPLEPGKYRYRVVLRDTETGAGAVGQTEAEIVPAVEQGLQIYPPLLLASGQSGLFVRGYMPPSEKGKFPLMDYFPFDPEKSTPLLDVIPGDGSKIQALLHCAMPGLDKPALKFTARLIMSETGQSFALPLSILSGKKDGDMGTLLTELRLPALPPGEYRLDIKVEDTASGAASQSSLTCSIRSDIRFLTNLEAEKRFYDDSAGMWGRLR
jgi:VWFA-related protein